jgi:hypothetical protein
MMAISLHAGMSELIVISYPALPYIRNKGRRRVAVLWLAAISAVYLGSPES